MTKFYDRSKIPIFFKLKKRSLFLNELKKVFFFYKHMEQYLIDEIIYSYTIVYIAYINDELISSLNYRKKYTPPQKKKSYMRL